MSILLSILDLLINSIVAIDTLGLIVATRKNSNIDTHEMWRLCFTWICFIVLNLCMTCCSGYLGSLLCMIGLLAKVWIGLPKLGGSQTVFNYIGSGQLMHFCKAMCDTLKAKCGVKEKAE